MVHLDTYILQIPHHLGGLGITPGKPAGIAAFYSATARFVQWLGTLPNKEMWVRNQDIHDPSTWTAPDLCSLCDLHATLIREYHCVEGPLFWPKMALEGLITLWRWTC